MRTSRLAVAVAVAVALALALGIAGGYMYRRWKNPTLEERAQDAAKDVRRGLQKLVR